MNHALASAPLPPLQALHWQLAMGVDETVGDTPQMPWALVRADLPRLMHEPSPRENAMPSPLTPEAPDRSYAPSTPSAAASSANLASILTEARALADSAMDLASLEQAVRHFEGCALKKTATTTVFAQGNPASGLMFIGEAPGADEDRAGVPFCGVSGQLLDTMLRFIGLTRAEHFYITNTLFWRPPGNRQPTPEELEICRPFVEKHVALVAPKRLVLLGGTATQSLLRETRGITRLRGQIFAYTNPYLPREIPVHVLYHPSYLLRQPSAKKQAWGDVLQLQDALRGDKNA